MSMCAGADCHHRAERYVMLSVTGGAQQAQIFHGCLGTRAGEVVSYQNPRIPVVAA